MTPWNPQCHPAGYAQMPRKGTHQQLRSHQAKTLQAFNWLFKIRDEIWGKV